MGVVDLAQARKDREPHLNGRARCLACQHEWVAVGPSGTVWLDYPACSLLRGRYIGPVQQEGDHWQCNCGNDLFYATPNGFYCPSCGLDQHGF